MAIDYYKQSNGSCFSHTEWNPDGDYSDQEYAKVYFRINTPSYRSGNPTGGFTFVYDASGKLVSPDREAWYQEINDLFRSLGWEEAGCYFVLGKQHLYLHPDNVSGTVCKKDIKAIAEALNNNRTFSLRWVDVYEDVYDVTDEEYLSMLDGKKELAKAMILNAAKTSRRDHFQNASPVCEYVGRAIHFPRIGLTDGCGYVPGDRKELAYAFVQGLIDELIALGWLEEYANNTCVYIRTINKTEQKKAKVNLEKFIADRLGGDAA